MLVIILIGFSILSLTYSLVTKLKFGPDEPAHFIYIRSLAVDHTFPPIAHWPVPTEDSTSTHEGHQPPLYYTLMAIPFALLNTLGLSGDIIWRILRLLNIPLGAAWIYFVYRLAREFFGSEPYALATTAFVALIPNAAYTAGVVNNETLISLLFTWAMVPILVYFKTGKITTRNAIFLGLLIGLAILTKAQGLILIAMFLIASLAVCRRVNYSNYRRVLASTAIVLGTTAVVGGWWYLRCYLMLGEMIPHSIYAPILPIGMIGLINAPDIAARVLWLSSGQLYGNFWIPFWLVQSFVEWKEYFYPLMGFSAFTLIGLIFRLRRDKNIDRRSLFFLFFTAFLVYLSWFRYVISVDQLANLQGRLLLSIAAVIGILAISSFDGWLKSARAKKAGIISGITLMLLANIAVIICTITFYAQGGA